MLNSSQIRRFGNRFIKIEKKEKLNLTTFIQYHIFIVMFITRESDYAVRIIRELSRSGREAVQDICGRELVPRQYAYKILKKLEKAGLVQGFRGVSGGYAMAKEAVDITLFDVITAVDGELLLSECMNHGYNCPLAKKGKKSCGVHCEFSRIQELILAHLKEKSLAELF